VSAVRVHGIAAAPLGGVASLGTRPTVNGSEPLLEAHVFDFDGDLYGRMIEVEFIAKLREEVKFDSLAAMVNQMNLDAAQARQILSKVDSD
jgi:riboflavin kinase / FMN adenylyltransferase